MEFNDRRPDHPEILSSHPENHMDYAHVQTEPHMTTDVAGRKAEVDRYWVNGGTHMASGFRVKKNGDLGAVRNDLLTKIPAHVTTELKRLTALGYERH